MKSTLLITLAFIFINNVKAQGIAYQPIAYQTEKDWKNLIAKKQDEEIKNRKNTIYFSLGFIEEYTNIKLNYQRALIGPVRLNIGIGAGIYGFDILYGSSGIYTFDLGLLAGLGNKKIKVIGGASINKIAYDTTPRGQLIATTLKLPLGLEFNGKRGFYLSSQVNYFPLIHHSEFQLGIGRSF